MVCTPSLPNLVARVELIPFMLVMGESIDIPVVAVFILGFVCSSLFFGGG